MVYDRGLSGTAKGVASKVADELQVQGFTVNLAGIKSRSVDNVVGYGVIVVGGQIYGGSPTSSVRDFFNSQNQTKVRRSASLEAVQA